MALLFWSSVAFIAYVYAGYPVLLGVWARIAGRRQRRQTMTSPWGDRESVPELPGVSIVIAQN